MTAPATDTTTIEHLDFEPACECGTVARKRDGECERPAKWIVTMHGCNVHQFDRRWARVLMCQFHLDQLRESYADMSSRGLVCCVACRKQFHRLSDLISDVVPL